MTERMVTSSVLLTNVLLLSGESRIVDGRVQYRVEAATEGENSHNLSGQRTVDDIALWKVGPAGPRRRC